MTPAETEAMLERLHARTSRIEQILPTLATKDDLRALADRFELRFDGVGARMDTLEARINAVSRQALVLHADLKSDVRLLAEHLARVLERLGP